jgi:septum formation topological specificity factor MinE
MTITQVTERLRKDLAQTWGVAPFRVEVVLASGRLDITVDGLPATQEQLDIFAERARTVANQARSRLK